MIWASLLCLACRRRKPENHGGRTIYNIYIYIYIYTSGKVWKDMESIAMYSYFPSAIIESCPFSQLWAGDWKRPLVSSCFIIYCRKNGIVSKPSINEPMGIWDIYDRWHSGTD